MSLIHVIAFLSGILSLFSFHALPSGWFVGFLFIIPIIIFFTRYKTVGSVFLFFCCGFAWSYLNVFYLTPPSVPSMLMNDPLVFVGKVIRFPVKDDLGTHTIASIQSITTLQHQQILSRGHIYLHSMHDEFKLGNTYSCLIRLSSGHGLKNPGALNPDFYKLANNIFWQAQAVSCQQIHAGWSIREKLYELLLPRLPDTPHAAWLMALMLGERGGVDPADWLVLGNTGTNHLMAIGGLHLGMLAGFVASLVSLIWRRSCQLIQIVSVKTATFFSAWLVCLLYAGIAGLGLATLRAFLMSTAMIVAFFIRHRVSVWQTYALAMFIVLIAHPLVVLLPEFWLSFLTIAFIVFGVSGRPLLKKWQHGYRLQYYISLGLVPVSLYFFQAVTLTGMLVNLIAIPWLGLTILPFCLMAEILVLFYPMAAEACLWVAGKSLAGLWSFLTFFSNQSFFIYHHSLTTGFSLFFVTMGLLLLLSPRGTSFRLLGFLLISPLFFSNIAPVKPGQFNLQVLDVGQGLSVVIQTAHHVLVYDAGGHLHPNDDKGEQVVLPYLRYQGISRIDTLLISHGDNDHAGGALTLIRHLPVISILTSVPEQFKFEATTRCERGQHWQWDGVQFLVLSPASSFGFKGNNASCVLMVNNGSLRVLLPGDIQRETEMQLLALNTPLKADILVAPHHGSATSSTSAFINAVSPRYVVFSTGFHNHYHLPHPVIVSRYKKTGALGINTATVGAIFFDSSAKPFTPSFQAAQLASR